MVLATLWIIGTALGVGLPERLLWGVAAAVVLAICLIWNVRRRDRAVRAWGSVTALLVAAFWAATTTGGVAEDDIRRLLDGDHSTLVRVEGTVASPVETPRPSEGYFSRFDHRPPGRHFSMDLDTIISPQASGSLSGRLRVHVGHSEAQFSEGDRIRVTGWLSGLSSPGNPGEFDYAAMLRSRGIHARLEVPEGNVLRLPEADGWLSRVRRGLGGEAAAALHMGLDDDPQRVAFLDALTLGRWSVELTEVSDSFRRTGLIHLLSLSGAHLSTLAALAWLIARTFALHPAHAACSVLGVLGFYLLLVPMEVPIIRAALMASLIVVGFMTGRSVRALDMLALSAVVVLVWRPGDVFDAGTQLSFLGVAGLLLFVRPLGLWLHPAPFDAMQARKPGGRLLRILADYTAANLVGAAVSFPLVAHHFGVVTPAAFLMSMAALPLVAGLLSLAFLKIMFGLLLPSVSLMLAWPTAWLSDTTISMVDWMSSLPAASFNVEPKPSILWSIGSIVFIVALFSGWFASRRTATMAAGVLLLAWLILPTQDRVKARVYAGSPDAALTAHALAVGDGSCYLIRIDPLGRTGGPYNIMFDCGSQQYLGVGKSSVVPALHAMGVKRIDILIISHADMDHFAGVLDVATSIPLGRVLTTRHVLQRAERSPVSATGYLMTSLEAMGVPIEEVAAGWETSAGGAVCRVLWPQADFVPRKAQDTNSTSIVLSVEASGQRVMLTGDIEQQAIVSLLESGINLGAEVVDLPHHGSFVEASPRWIKAVSPRVAIQSSGALRRHENQWSDVLSDHGIMQLITDRHGMVTVWIESDGGVQWSTFKSGRYSRR